MATAVRWFRRVGLVAVLAVAGCTGKPGAVATPTPSLPLSVPSFTAASPAAPTDQAVAAYLNLLHAFVAASNSGGTDTREMAKYATGEALGRLAKGLADNKAQGVKTQGQPGISTPRVVKIDPSASPMKVDLTGCVDDTHWLVYKDNGQLLNNTPGGPRPTVAEVTKIGGIWWVTQLAIHGVGTCTG